MNIEQICPNILITLIYRRFLLVHNLLLLLLNCKRKKIYTTLMHKSFTRFIYLMDYKNWKQKIKLLKISLYI